MTTPTADPSNKLATQIIDGQMAEMMLESNVGEIYEQCEPGSEESVQFKLGFDYYDNSVEFTLTSSHPYPYEPPSEILQYLIDEGFLQGWVNYKGNKGRDGHYDETYFRRKEDGTLFRAPRRSRGGKGSQEYQEEELEHYGPVEKRFDVVHYEARFGKRG